MLLKSGDQGIQVKYLQQGLKIMCCNPGNIDSTYGPGTQAAVEKFQDEWGLSVDGIVGDETWNCLMNEIKPIQQALKEKGFYTGAITGIAKETTYNGVINFQESRNLTADGMVGAATRARLFDESQGGGDESVLPLNVGDRGDYVLYLQYGLRILCCSPGAADGVFGTGTFEAVKKYQSKYGITETGVVDTTTWNALKEQIYDIQERLLDRGYHIAIVDGLATSALVEVIKQYQEANWLTADGQVGPSTYELLFSDVEDGATDALPLKLRSRGPQVLYFQYALRINCINPNGTDGIFGTGTESAVNRYKTNKGLTADGMVDTATWEKMREDIRPLQIALANRGYEVGYIDGIATEMVYNAVLQFQRDNGLTADGMVGTATKLLLLGGTDGAGTVSSTLKFGSNGSLTRYLQRLLNELGYSIPIDGIFAQSTKEAAIAFQTANGLESDGIVGGGTWAKLFEVYHVNVSGNGVEKLIKIAEHELAWGFAEDNANNITPYGQWYGLNGSAWCAMFVSYCAYQAGVLDTLVPRYAWCPSGMTWYKNNNRYHKRNSGYVPKKGDVIFFYNNELGRVAHTGIVVGGDEDSVITIEGNTSIDAVEQRTYSITNTAIDGYGDNGGESIYEVPEPTEDEILESIKAFIVEVIQSAGFSIMAPQMPVLEQDIVLYQDLYNRVTFKCSRGSSWYLNADSPVSFDFSFGSISMGASLTPNISIALENVENAESIGDCITSLSMYSEEVPVKFELSVEGEWMKFSYIVEATVQTGDHHEDTVSCGFTLWTRNVPENQLAPVYVEVEERVTSPSYDVGWKVVVGICIVGAVFAAVALAPEAGAVAAAAACATIIVNADNNQGGNVS